MSQSQTTLVSVPQLLYLPDTEIRNIENTRNTPVLLTRNSNILFFPTRTKLIDHLTCILDNYPLAYLAYFYHFIPYSHQPVIENLWITFGLVLFLSNITSQKTSNKKLFWISYCDFCAKTGILQNPNIFQNNVVITSVLIGSSAFSSSLV